jgi:hypothetical protein
VLSNSAILTGAVASRKRPVPAGMRYLGGKELSPCAALQVLCRAS